MAVESTSYPSGLDSSVYGPESTDDPTEGAAQIKLLKVVLETTFPNLSGPVTSTHTELNKLTGVTATTAELNILDGVTATAAELNILDGVTATAAELNILDGVTSTAAELNILDGVTATAAELNILDGVTSTAAELNILDGVTANATELNILAGTTAVTADLDKIAAVASTATEIDTRVLQVEIADISTADTVLVFIPYTGNIVGVYSVLENAITTADDTVTLKTSADAAIASLTVAFSGSASGDIDSDEAPTNAAVTAGTYVKLATDGASDTAARLWVTIKIEIT